MIAVDPDGEALARLAARAAERGLAGRIELVHGDLLTVDPRGDAVLFEFCLHEMPDPERALDHASTLAPDVLVVDHAPGSPWMGHAGEEAGVAVCWAAVARRAVRRRLDVEAVQRFEDYAEVEASMARQGPTSRERIDALRSRRPIALSMPYRLVLL